MPVLIVIFIISFLIIIHELGHFIAARKTKVNVEEFGLGYPPKLATLFSWKETDFTLNLIPFGGFVRLEGENIEDIKKSQKKESISKKNKNTPFYAKAPKQKMIVTLAGVFVNLIFAIVAFSIVFSFLGIPVSLENQARVGLVVPESPAADASLPENVNIVKIEVESVSYQIQNFNDVQQAVQENLGSQLTITATGECDGLSCPEETNDFQVYARTEDETPAGEGSLGIVFQDVVLNFYPWYEMPFRGTWYGLKQAIGLGILIVQALGQMMIRLAQTGSVSRDVAGPIGIVHQAQQGNIISDNFWMNLGFAGMLSLNLAIINLLPIPALDGGRALFILFEKIFGQRKIEKIEIYANYVGFALLITLIITITISDISRIING